jgi:hypothetical protein
MSIQSPGIYADMSCDEYFADPCPEPSTSNSINGVLLNRTPKHAWAAHPRLGQRPDDRRETAAKYRGSLVHRLALGKGSDFSISPYDEFRTSEAKAWKKEVTDRGAIPVKQKDYDTAKAMAVIAESAIEDAVEGHEYETEVVFAWQEDTPSGKIWCRGMADIWVPEMQLIVDLKTCISASDDSVDRSFNNYGYARQGTFYPRGFDAINGTPNETRFLNLFVESEYPYCTRTADPSEGMQHGSDGEVDKALRMWGKCLSTGEWPGYSHRRVSPKPWTVQQWMLDGIDMEGYDAGD